jgi:sirohydrochlorin ferrochelatase
MNRQQPGTVGVIIADHGSRRASANSMFERMVSAFEQSTAYAIVEPAHMDLAEPSIATAFNRCVERGAELVVVFPYFLLPGRHCDEDIPALVREAAGNHQGVDYLIAEPFGLHPKICQIIEQRIDEKLST